jgi:hypothetical protein
VQGKVDSGTEPEGSVLLDSVMERLVFVLEDMLEEISQVVAFT